MRWHIVWPLCVVGTGKVGGSLSLNLEGGRSSAQQVGQANFGAIEGILVGQTVARQCGSLSLPDFATTHPLLTHKLHEASACLLHGMTMPPTV